MPSSQLVRQWKVLQELAASRRGRTLDELAAVADAHPRTLRRDLVDLETAGFPLLHEQVDRQVFHRLLPGYRLPHIPLDLNEALALQQAARSGALFPSPAFHRALESALAKVLDAFPERVRAYLGRVDVAWSHRSPGPPGAAVAVVRVLQEQVADRCRVLLGYRRLGGERTERTVDPYLLRLHEGETYLLAHCHLRHEARVFRVDRIERAEPLDEEFTLPKGVDPAALFRSSLGVYLGPSTHAVVRFDGPAAATVAERPLHPDQQVVERGDDTLTVRVPIRGFDEITHHVLRFGRRAEVLEPADLRRHLAAEVQALAGRYDGVECPE